MILTVLTKPGSSKTRAVGWRDASSIIISVAAPAIEGKANRALIEFLSKSLHIAPTLITIKRGAGGRVKHVELPDGTDLSPLR